MELLKLRFGESNLHFCEVMIKDVADSRRINTLITTEMRREREVCGQVHNLLYQVYFAEGNFHQLPVFA